MNEIRIKRYVGVGLVFIFSSSLWAGDVKNRWGIGAAGGVSDFLTSQTLQETTDAGPFAAGWVRHGLTGSGEVMVALDNVQANGKESRSLSRLRSVTLNWVESFGGDTWTPYVTAGGGPGWVRRTGALEPNRMVVALRAGTGVERMLGQSLGLGLGLTYHYALSDGRYAPSSAAMGVHVAGTWYFWCGERSPEPPKVQAPLVSAPPSDADRDGVPDSRDACPGTPPGVAVDALGCPLDSDGDGVLDGDDKCPDTPAGTLINEEGCPAKQISVKMDVKFQTGKITLSRDDDPQLKKVADFMKRFPSTTVVIEGHSDSVGSAQKNKILSQKRADAVRSALVDRFNVPAERVSAKGYGAEIPLASNATPEGRAINRRVVATLSAMK